VFKQECVIISEQRSAELLTPFHCYYTQSGAAPQGLAKFFIATEGLQRKATRSLQRKATRSLQGHALFSGFAKRLESAKWPDSFQLVKAQACHADSQHAPLASLISHPWHYLFLLSMN